MNEQEPTDAIHKEVSMEMDEEDFFSDDSFQELTEEEPPFSKQLIRDQEGDRLKSNKGSLRKFEDEQTIPSDSVKSNIQIAEERNHLRQ